MKKIVWSLIALAIQGATDKVNGVIWQSVVQLEAPNEMRGSVKAVHSVLIGAGNQLGEFESGGSAAWRSSVGSVVLDGVGTVIIALT